MTTPEATTPDGMSIANELIRARATCGLSQAQLAEASGVSRSAIKAYESGRNMPGSRELRALCVALKVTPNRLLFGTEAPAFGEGDAAVWQGILRADPLAHMVKRGRLVALVDLLTAEEADSLALLAHAIALARHGQEKVAESFREADQMAADMRAEFERLAATPVDGRGRPES